LTNTTDDLLTTGWAAPPIHPTTAETALVHQLERAQSVAVALRNAIHQQAATIAELASRNIAAGECAARERAHRIRLEREIGGLRGRLDALQRANEAGDAGNFGHLKGRPGGILESPGGGLQPVPGRWIPFVRGTRT
jgi:hypothetical protein